MKIGILGYGRMGRIVENIAKQRGHEIVSIIDVNNPNEINKNVDCYIDFSISAAIKSNIKLVCKYKVPVVIGTTGWFDQREEFEKLFAETGNIGIWSGNFSLGVNLFWQTVSQASKLFDKFATQYDVMIHEFHHKNKIDSPSGTALQTADMIIENSSIKNKVVTESLHRHIEQDEIHVTSTRGGAIPGTHSVIFDSDFDNIEIRHTARTRQGFAVGALLAAENIKTLKPGLHNFSDIFNTIFG